MTIAIVDDDFRIRESLAGLFEAAHIRTDFFTSAEEFLAGDPGHYACIVTDIKMLAMSGYELQRQVVNRQIESPVIFVSSRRDDDALRSASLLGNVAFLQKPFDGEELLELVQTFLEPKGQ